MQFIWSLGGPFVMMETSLLAYWGGTDYLESGYESTAVPVSSGLGCDYDRACATRPWIEPISVWHSQAIVFSGDKMEIGVLQSSRESALFVRPYSDGGGLDAAVKLAVDHSEKFEHAFECRLHSAELTLFDSAFPGSEIITDRLVFELEPGRYTVQTYHHEAEDAEVIFHRFSRMP